MEELASFQWPAWLGTPSQFALLAVVVITLIKTWPLIQKNLMDAKLLKEGGYAKRITDLEGKLDECKRDCDERDRTSQTTIDSLKQQINNEAWQRVQSEISLVNTLIQIVPNPMLGQILEALKKRSGTLQPIELDGPVKDTQGEA